MWRQGTKKASPAPRFAQRHWLHGSGRLWLEAGLQPRPADGETVTQLPPLPGKREVSTQAGNRVQARAVGHRRGPDVGH